MRVGVLGINYKLADFRLRELLAKACQRRFGPGNSIHGHHAFVLLSTCNRTEVYFCSQNLTETHSYLLNILREEINQEFDHKLYSYFGPDCFSHLCEVTAGFNSAIFFETEIQGQVKCAYETAAKFQPLPSELHYLFQKALRVSKQVRNQFSLGRGMPDLEHAIFQIGSHFFQSIKETRVLFVGASKINQKIIYHLKAKGIQTISLCNRSLEKAEEMAKKSSIQLVEWKNFASWPTYDWIIFGTKSPNHLITYNHVREQVSRKLIMDLSFPRNVDPLVSKKHTLLNLHQLSRTLNIRKQRMTHLLSDAQQLISESTTRHINKFLSKNRPIESQQSLTG